MFIFKKLLLFVLSQIRLFVLILEVHHLHLGLLIWKSLSWIVLLNWLLHHLLGVFLNYVFNNLVLRIIDTEIFRLLHCLDRSCF